MSMLDAALGFPSPPSLGLFRGTLCCRVTAVRAVQSYIVANLAVHEVRDATAGNHCNRVAQGDRLTGYKKLP